MYTLLINVYINSVTDYCLKIWGPSRVSDFAQIQKVTNNLLAIFFFPNIVKYKKKRFWCNRDAEDLVKAKKECIIAHRNLDYYNLLEKCNLLTITERLEFYSLWNIYKIRKFKSKVVALNEMYSPRINLSTVKTRSSNNCNVIDHTTQFFANSCVYYSSSLWNAIPRELTNLENPNLCFRAGINKWLLDKRSDDFVHS
jgi:hypothetical protein